MKPRNEFREPSQRNTLSGYIELTLWHGQRVCVKLDAIIYICEHTAGIKTDGTRVGVAGDALYCRNDFQHVMSCMTAEQSSRFLIK